MANHEEIESRIDVLLGLKAEGHSYTVLVKLAMKHWNIGNRQAKRYMGKVRAREKEIASASSLQLLGNCLNQVDRMINKAMQNNDLDLCQKLLGKKIQIVGLIQKLQLTKAGGKLNEQVSTQPQIQPGELDALLATFENEWPEATEPPLAG